MRWVEALGGQVAECPREAPVVDAAEAVAVVLDEPEIPFPAEAEDLGQVEGVAQGMGHEYGPGTALDIGPLQLVHPQVAGPDVGVDEDRHGAALDDRGDGGGEAGGDGDHLV